MPQKQEVSRENMETIVQDHEKRILALEQNYGEVKKELTSVQTIQMETKGTLLEEGQKQRELINKQREEIDQQRKEQKELMGQLINHTLGIKKNNNNMLWKVLIAFVSGGGVLYTIFDLISKNV
ncbi:hypothetical protein [Niallia sp. NCCP-28]|uniref:hypothetical protein n=1 Tax=Niallia sp. NCCP-28 TaxID=2934712 RepID=UPI00208624FB|nr:hypothetical protein [Niallia sp. NCCP-28]GKU81190.1 hypothetical protein NCCP28_05860 [Niallia sp. NCCP-28]